jgi:hypothetical protein
MLVDGLLEGYAGGRAVGRICWWTGCWKVVLVDELMELLVNGLLEGCVGE